MKMRWLFVLQGSPYQDDAQHAAESPASDVADLGAPDHDVADLGVPDHELERDFHELEQLHDLLEPLDAMDMELVEGSEERAVRSSWLEVADLPVTAGARRTVRDAAYLILDELVRCNTTFEAASRQQRMIAHSGVLPGRHGPGEGNMWPPSLHICRTLLEVPDLSHYQRDVCPNGCKWYFERLVRPEDHLRNCEGCDYCCCPLCKAERYTTAASGTKEAASKCYFLHDALEQWFLDPEWVGAFSEAWSKVGTPEASAWHQSKEFRRIMQTVRETAGARADTIQVCSIVYMHIVIAHRANGMTRHT